MYLFLLLICAAAVILSPLLLDLWLTMAESRAERRFYLSAGRAKPRRDLGFVPETLGNS